MARIRILAVVAALALSSCSCGEDAPLVGPPDAGSGRADGGVPSADAGPDAPDAALVEPDAGASDAGAVEPDAGAGDAGSAAADGGAAPPDGGPSGGVDAGPVTAVPDPERVAPPLPGRSIPTFAERNAFLWTGGTPLQHGGTAGALEGARLAVLRGVVRDPGGQGVQGARVSVPAHPEWGWSLTRADGRFDLAVNGGGQVVLEVSASGFLRAQRDARPSWSDYEAVDEIVLRELDNHATTLDLVNAPAMAVATGSTVVDARGARTGRLLVPAGTTASLVMPDGAVGQVGALTVRVTEYTQGAADAKTMPAALPPSSAFTYAAEFSADEADAVGAASVTFSRPLFHYVENFLGFPVGKRVPTGYYDRARAVWVPSDDGRVVQVLSESAGAAVLDTDGDGRPDDAAALAALGVTAEELATVAALYAPGQTLWRVPVPHFTPYDCNWPWRYPTDAVRPQDRGARVRNAGDSPESKERCPPEAGSIIDCESRALGELVDLPGTPMKLHYRSDRQPAYDRATLDVTLATQALPASADHVELVVTVAGKTTSRTYAPAAATTDRFAWDGLDAYGRPVTGSQPADVEVRYWYPGVYVEPMTGSRAFGALPDESSSIVLASGSGMRLAWRQAFKQAVTKRLGFWDDLGGWSLTPHHAYDPAARRLYRGDGDVRDIDTASTTVRTAAGRGSSSGGSGTLASGVALNSPSGLAVMPDGSYYLTTNLVGGLRYVDVAGRISTVSFAANPGDPCSDGFGGFAEHLAYDGRGSLYFTRDSYTAAATGGWGLVCRLDLATRKVHLVAGRKQGESAACQTGPAATVVLGDSLHGVAVGPDGSVFFSDDSGDCVRRILPDGTIERVLGGGSASPGTGADPRSLRITDPQGLDVTADGTVYVAGYGDGRVYRVGPDASFAIVAGVGASAPAPTTALGQPRGVRVSPEGYVYVTELGTNRVRRIAPDGTTEQVAGGGVGFKELAHPLDVAITRPMAIAFMPDHTEASPHYLLTGQGVNSTAGHRVYRVGRPSLQYSNGEILVPDGERLEIYVFDATGRHLETRHLGTGAFLWRFGYDASGRLSTLTDRDGNTTRLNRNAAGGLLSVDGPYGARTLVTLDAAGRLLSATSPGARTTTLAYDAAGLLASFTRPDGTTHRYTYDADGRLATDTLPSGGVLRMSATSTDVDREVTFTKPSGLATRYRWEPGLSGGGRRTVTFPTGAVRVIEYAADGSRAGVLEDGSVEATTYGPDPRFGLTMPYVAEHKVTSPTGRIETRTLARTVALADAADLLSYTTWSDAYAVDGLALATDAWSSAARTRTVTGRDGTSSVTAWDTLGRVSSTKRDTMGLASMDYAYDAHGRITGIKQGADTWTYGYDAAGRLASRTSPAGGATALAWDADDHVTGVTHPGGATGRFVTDAAGRTVAVVTPAGSTHRLAPRYDAAPADYTPPGAGTLSRRYDLDNRWTGNTLASGRTVSVTRDALGRTASIAHGDSTTTFAYAGGSLLDRPASITVAPADASLAPVVTRHQLDGKRLSVVETSGPAASRVAFQYDTKGRPVSRTFSSGADSAVDTYTYANGLLASDGRLTLRRSAGGLPSATLDGSTMTTTYAHDALGRLTAGELVVAGAVRHSFAVTYDTGGHVTLRSETLGGVTRSLASAYTARGMLSSVSDGATSVESYAYDADGNRILSGAESATYDAQDRLVARGGTAYGHDADGWLSSRGGDRFAYDARGELVSATVAGLTAKYQYDALMRRVARVDPAGITQYFYADPSNPYRLTGWRVPGQPLATLRFDHAGRAVMLEQAGVVQYLATDHVGSPRAVFSASGALVRELRYDAFGQRTFDSAAATPLPLGFSGGLHDEVTGLVRLGLRDYDPASGRWTGRDPLLFGARRLNLYEYVGNDPLSLVDPLGLWAFEAAFYKGFGAGVRVAWTDEGISVCAEGGVGLGETLGITDAGLDSTGYSVSAELGVDCFLGGVTAGVDVTWPCGSLEFSPKLEAAALGNKWEFKPGPDEAKVHKPGTPEFDEAGKLKCSLGGKVAFKGCGQFLY